MGRRSFAVLGGLMMSAGVLIAVTPVSTGVAPASTASLRKGKGSMRPFPVRSVTAPFPGGPRLVPARSVV
ncbi:hypothetical protein ACRB68_59290 [Actinomadura sp. RB68]|uniref:Uncharacterized protein n=1 Tax=Actinomadura macrotermitis TaxID=2585200 RepID=A0A7K0C2W8_9ACTN|nr:hypothetical protein [Actinomadura macrotermitis]